MTEPLSNIEQLLETLGANEIPGDTKHRYALRRALLGSSVFVSNRTFMRWFHVFTVTGSALAGGLVVAIVVVSAGTIGSMRSLRQPVVLQVVEIPVEQPVFEGLYSLDFSEFITRENVDAWIPASINFASAQ